MPAQKMLAEFLARPLPYSTGPVPLLDRTKDPGLFGPDSVTWRVMREPLLILSAGRALLMQAANPLVAQGAIDHSSYREDPYGRLERTVEWVTVVCFGTTSEARRITRSVNLLHRKVAGALPAGHGTQRWPSGRLYSASDRDLLRWVHASFVDTMLTAHDVLIGGLRESERDRFVREWDSVALLMGLPRRMCWPNAAALRAYVEEEIASGRAVPGKGSQLVARTVLHPPVRTPLMRPGTDALAFIATGQLPDRLRRAYGLVWTPAHAAAFKGFRLSLAAMLPVLPRRLRVSPVYDLALARTQGRWPRRLAA
jgi:uncharacterized protein (DUF2236 family)